MDEINESDGENCGSVRIKKKKNSFPKQLRKYFREFNEVTGIHGLRYTTEKRSRIEKFVWIIILLISLGGCIYMIYEILYKYQNTPVVVSFATEDTPLYEIPFPAITICPEPKFLKEKFNYSQIYHQVRNHEEIDINDYNVFQQLSLVCNEPEISISKDNKFESNNFYETLDKLKIPLNNFFLFCVHNDKEFKCDQFFTPIIIDEGICYSFNIYGREEIFKKNIYHYNNFHDVINKSGDYFNLENGYKKTAGVETYPRRALASGADNSFGLMFKYDLNNTDYICNSFFRGFRVVVHNPWDIPRASENYFRIPLNKIVLAAMEPEMVITSETVRKFNPEKRKCYMSDERSLKYFQYYTQSNCLLECVTNYTLQKCGCVAFYMPRFNETKICGRGSQSCYTNIEVELKIKQLEMKLSGVDFCDCKPACTNLKYKVGTSHSDFIFGKYFEALMPNLVFEGANWSVLQIYFKDEQFTTLERNELYGISDLISNLGGLLGLFTGFSLITAVEILYFCSLRIFCNERMYGVWSGLPD